SFPYVIPSEAKRETVTSYETANVLSTHDLQMHYSTDSQPHQSHGDIFPARSNEPSRFEATFRGITKLGIKVESLSYEQASQRCEIERQNRHIDRQNIELDKLREAVYSLMASSKNSSNVPDVQEFSHANTDANGTTSNMLYEKVEGQIYPSRRDSGIIMPLSASQHIRSQHQNPGYTDRTHPSQHQRVASRHVHQSTQDADAPHSMLPHDIVNLQGYSHSIARESQPSPFQRQHANSVSSYRSPADLYSSGRSRASSASVYAPSNSSVSSAGLQSHSLFALASASGVVLPEYERSGQPNYRQLLQDHATVEYNSIIRLILDRNDQQASIFLQQKLKSCPDPVKRSQIIDSTLPYAFDLITNRFGNFTPNLYKSLKEIKNWSNIAMDETGSLLCQAVLENWPAVEKEGIVKSLIRDTVALCGSQWATFVVLHLIEHGKPEERDEIFSILLRSAVTISQDQYGAKAIEKMIKVAGMSSDVIKDYVQQICNSSHGRPAVVPICQNANGSQIVTLLLTTAPIELKELLIEAIRRHGVTLKGSKHGSRICLERALELANRIPRDNTWSMVTVLLNMVVNEPGCLQNEDGYPFLKLLDQRTQAGTFTFVPEQDQAFSWRVGPQSAKMGPKVQETGDDASSVATTGTSHQVGLKVCKRESDSATQLL
ncbi:MAG: hypothetical protein CYPHOPRED_004374, partial [Cyphobasidiales sp. Tagirdzhanova-0007]